MKLCRKAVEQKNYRLIEYVNFSKLLVPFSLFIWRIKTWCPFVWSNATVFTAALLLRAIPKWKSFNRTIKAFSAKYAEKIED